MRTTTTLLRTSALALLLAGAGQPRLPEAQAGPARNTLSMNGIAINGTSFDAATGRSAERAGRPQAVNPNRLRLRSVTLPSEIAAPGPAGS